MEELQLLWIGVDAQDFSKPTRQCTFKLCWILMWTISDFPRYRLISSLCTHGYKACTACGPATNSRLVKSGNTLNTEKNAKGKKMVYGGRSKRFHRNHLYCQNLDFNGKMEFGAPPQRMSLDKTVC